MNLQLVAADVRRPSGNLKSEKSPPHVGCYEEMLLLMPSVRQIARAM
jgi:hypothetical protein